MQKINRFTRKELKKFDGTEGRPAYIAFKGKVFDVSDSVLWTDGKHQGRHSAGDELAEHMPNAPHSEEVLMNLHVVGELVEDESLNYRFAQRLQRLPLHPILVHFSIAYSVLVPLLTLLYFFTGEISFETSSYYLLFFGFLAAPFAGVSGLFIWKVIYEGRLSKVFSRKIALTAILMVVSTACFLWRILDLNILIARTDLSYIYMAMVISFIPIVTILGHYGGKIVHI